MLNNPNSMQGVSGNEFLKDGCYFTNVVQSLLKTNDFLINKCFILLLYFFFSGAAETCRKHSEFY